jgi:hypothetical protein
MRETSERLAAWLEGLGLADQLGAAGLPTFERDAGGTARWRDPGTGEPMTSDQLEGLDRLLHSEGEDAAHAIPLALVQLRRQAQVRATLLASETLDYAGVAALRGATENAARFAVHKAAERRALLVLQHEGSTLVPAFQLTANGELRPELGAVLEPLLASGMDPWQVWTWLTQPAGLLGGGVPHEVARDPDELPVVQHAAVRLAERAR